MTFKSLPPAGGQLESASAIILTFFFVLVFQSFNFICVQSISSNDAEFVKQSDGALFMTPCSVTSNGGAVRVCPHVQISDTAPALVSEEKSKKSRVAPALYVPVKKGKVILSYDTLNTVQLDPGDRKYDQ
jgi:hypothetical protein